MNEAKVSCVIPTFNRCPYEQRVELNPIWWAADSLFRQSNIGEIIFVDDASQDYISETVGRIDEVGKSFGVDVRYIRNEERIGSGESRNRGVDSAVNDYVFFMDDDCIVVGDDVLFKLQRTFDILKRESEKVGALSLPVSSGDLNPEVYHSSKIGKLDGETGFMHGVYMRFPSEYIDHPDYLDLNLDILRPIEIDFTGGVFLFDRDVYLEAGGFPKTRWRNASAEEAEFMLNMGRKGHKTFYLPSLDEKFSVFHFKFGDPFRERFVKESYPFEVSGVSLEEILESSLEGSPQEHGNRVNETELLYSTMVSRIRLIFKYYGNQTGLNYLRTTFSDLKTDPDKINVFGRSLEDGLMMMDEEGIIDREISNKISRKYAISA
jgi:GT2 family glycosyltransferase